MTDQTDSEKVRQAFERMHAATDRIHQIPRIPWWRLRDRRRCQHTGRLCLAALDRDADATALRPHDRTLAYARATSALRARHRAEFEQLYADELDAAYDRRRADAGR